MSTAVETSEKAFQSAVLELAALQGWKCAHFHDSRRQIKPGVFVGDASAAGFPDLVLVRGTRVVFVELKREKGRVTQQQREWLDVLEAALAEVYLWKPKDWDQIEKVLA